EIPVEITETLQAPAGKAETDSARKPGLFEIFLRFLGIGGNGHGAEQNKIVFSESTKEDPEIQGGQLFFSKERKKPSLAEHAAAVHADIVVFGHSHQFTRLYDAKRKVYLFNPGCLAGDAADLKEMEGASVPEELMPDGAYGISSYSLLDFGILEIDGAEIRFRGFRLPDR
ncbi:MAG: hypothetical protein Q4D81_15535, partial [Eubacteriales bacterium]|nr:hypothetical protein [Eubacteriales bacterium]